MPRMNGFEACKVIRSLPDDRNKLPIIALTANAFEENRKDCLDAGMSEHVSKPIKIQSLLQTIESVLKKIAASPLFLKHKCQNVQKCQ